MTECPPFGVNLGLSDEEKNDLEEMSGQFQEALARNEPMNDFESIAHQSGFQR